MMENYDEEYWKQKSCPKYDCRKESCKCGLKRVFLASALGDDSKDSPVAPKNGAYCNALVIYEANDRVYIYSTEGVPTLINVEGGDWQDAIEEVEKRLTKETSDREAADNVLQGEIDDIKNSPDVVDIVATYAALQAYDTSKLGDNDIVRVLQDEQHDGQSTYYRWNKQSSTWTYIGAVGDYYTKGQVDTLLGDKQDKLTAGSNITIDANNEISATDTTYTAGANVNISAQNVISATDTTYSDFTGATTQQAGTSGLVPAPTTSDPDKYLKGDGSWGTPTGTTYTAGTNVSISSGNVISATDTTYSNFTGTDGNTDGTAGLVPAPLTTDAGKFLKADGTWDTAGGDETITILTSDDYNYPINNPNSVSLGLLNTGFYRPADDTVYIYENTRRKNRSICLYYVSGTNSNNTKFAYVFYPNADVSSADYKINTLGYDPATGSAVAWLNKGILSEDYVVNNLNSNASERVLSAAQGKALKEIIDGLIIKGAGAPTTSTVGAVGKLYEDTTNGKLYQCTAIDTTDPNNPSYTWSEVGAGGGGGPTVVQTTGTSQTDVMSQNATSSMVFADPGTNKKFQLGPSGVSTADTYFCAYRHDPAGVALSKSVNIFGQNSGVGAVSIGSNAIARLENQVAIGSDTLNNYSATSGVAIGYGAQCLSAYSVAIGTNATTSRSGEINVGAGTSGRGYNSTNYRVIGGVHDPIDNHDAATKGYVDAHVGGPVTLLTSADYNWDSTGQGGDPDAIAGWLLDDGWYITDDTTNVYMNSDNGDVTNLRALFQINNGGQEFLEVAYGFRYCTVNPADGTIASGYTLPDGTIIPAEINIQDMMNLIVRAPIAIDEAPTTGSDGALGQLWTDTTTMHTYQCTGADYTDPDNPVFTWTQRW